MGKHRGDGGDGYSVHGRDNRGAKDGDQNPGRSNDAENRFDQAEADARAQRNAERNSDK